MHGATSLVALGLLLVSALTAGADLRNDQKDNLRHIAGEIIRCTRAPGLTFSILDLINGTMYEMGEGRSRNQAIGAHHTFCIGDATQAFSAVLLAMLIDANDTVSWDMPVEELIGSRTYFPDMYRTEHLNLKDIFAMRSGMAGMDIVPWAQPYDQDKLIANLRYAPVAAPFREKYVHNNVLFSLVQKVTEALGGDTWHNLMRQYILGPLNMKSTWFAGPSMAGMRSGKQIALGALHHSGQNYYLESQTYDGLEMIAPAASLCTSARDMYQWFRFLLKDGVAETSRGARQMLKKETLEMLYQGILPRGRDGDPETEGYRQSSNRYLKASYSRTMNSLGFINGNYKGYEFVSQDGSLPGYQTLATIIPTKDIAVFVSILGDEKPKNFVAKVLMNIVGLDLMLQGESWVKPQELCNIMDDLEQLHPRHETGPLRNVPRAQGPSPRPLRDYARTYKNWAFGNVVVKHNVSGNDRLTMEYGAMKYRLARTNLNDTFEMVVIDGPLWYSTNADWYRDFNQLYAVFAAAPVRTKDDDDDDDDGDDDDSDDSNDKKEKRREERVMNVTIAGFDSQSDPVFAVRARRPYFERQRMRNVECSAPSCLLNSPAIMSLWAIALFSSAISFFR